MAEPLPIVRINGTITDAWFDAPFFAQDIDRGVITPSSVFVRQLREALADGGDVEIHINSVGGDVFAGAEMLAAIQDARERVTAIVVDGLAASMAANIAIMAGRPLRVHTNTLLYFHSAASDVWGGPGAHEDEAELLHRINAPMIDALKRAGMDAETVETGFEDGRSLVLDANDAAQYLGAEIIGIAASAPTPATADTIERLTHPADSLDRLADYTATLRHVARLAAWAPVAEQAEQAEPAEPVETEATVADQPNPSEQEPEPAPEPEQEPQPEPAGDAGDIEAATAETAAAMASLEKQLRAVQSGAGKKIASLTARLTSAEKQRDEALAKLAELTKQATALAASLDVERNARNALVQNVLAPESDIDESATPASATPYSDKLASLRTVDERLEYAQAHRTELAAERSRLTQFNR